MVQLLCGVLWTGRFSSVTTLDLQQEQPSPLSTLESDADPLMVCNWWATADSVLCTLQEESLSGTAVNAAMKASLWSQHSASIFLGNCGLTVAWSQSGNWKTVFRS